MVPSRRYFTQGNRREHQCAMDAFLFLFYIENGILCVITDEAILMITHNIPSLKKIKKISLFASCSDAMINTHLLEQPLSQTYFHSPKGVRAIELSLYRIYLAIRRGFHLSRMTTNNLISSM